MNNRGRGKGRGRGAISFDYTQLGFSAGESLPAPVLQPPPIFPHLEHKPVALKSGPEIEYMVALRRDFVEFLKYSLSFKQTNDTASGIERFSDKYGAAFNGKDNWDSMFVWNRLPLELAPSSKVVAGKRKKSQPTPVKSSKKINKDLTIKLDQLAKLEERAEEESEETKEEKEEENEENEEENAEEEDEDDEMDDGTDYVNSYFDNGENYFEDEDDNLDDGPVY